MWYKRTLDSWGNNRLAQFVLCVMLVLCGWKKLQQLLNIGRRAVNPREWSDASLVPKVTLVYIRFKAVDMKNWIRLRAQLIFVGLLLLKYVIPTQLHLVVGNNGDPRLMKNVRARKSTFNIHTIISNSTYSFMHL